MAFGKGKNCGYRKEESALIRFGFSPVTVIMSSEGTLENQVRTLTELVSQLKAGNQRLKGGGNSSSPSDSAPAPPSNVVGTTPLEHLV